MKEMIDKYKQEVPEEEFADIVAVERGETKFIVGIFSTASGLTQF